MIYAYVAGRAITRRSSKGLRYHAVDETSLACGALDAMCGRPMAKLIGGWDPNHPNSCQKCTKTLAELEEVVT